ncbi:type II secretion system F family protein [Planctomicrobium sp. SH668]|uniref:type II secretion system F family protein n=1 Tax=Planctomicrobium sp. SH668 TaxID=3448126 RepID=UPI003F5BC21C
MISVPPQLIPYLPIISCVLVFIAVVVGTTPIFRVWDQVTLLYLYGLVKPLQDSGYTLPGLFLGSRIVAIIAIVVLSIGIVIKMYILTGVVGVLFLIIPRLYLGNRVETHKVLLRNQLAAACTGLASASRAGMSLPQAIAEIVNELPEPIRSEFSRISRDFRGGMPLQSAIGTAKDRLNLDTFSIFAISIATCYDHGGNETVMLDKIANNINEVQRLERRMLSETAAARQVVWILSLFPFLFLAVMGVLHPSGTQLMFTTIVGQVLMTMTILMIAGSIAWSRSILSMKL